METTPPWERNKRVHHESPERVFWQSSQNTRFLATVMQGVAPPSQAKPIPAVARSISAPASLTTKRPRSATVSGTSRTSSMLSLASPSDSKRPRRGRRSAPDDHDRAAPPDVDIDHVASLVLNVSQSLRERTGAVSDFQSSKSKECSASATRLPTNTLRLHDNLLDMTNETDISLNARGNHRIPQPSQSIGAQPRVDSMDIHQDTPNSHAHPSNPSSQHQSINMEKASSSQRISSSSQLGRASSLTTRLSARERPPFPSENAGQYGHSSVVAVTTKKSRNLSPPSRPHAKPLPSIVKSKTLGMKGMPKSGLVTAGAAKPFKVPLVASRVQAIVSEVPATTPRGAPPAQPTPIDVLANTSSSSDSFDMDSFGPDLEAVEACLQKFD